MQGSGISSKVVVSSVEGQRRLMLSIYAYCLFYIIVSFFALGFVSDKLLHNEAWEMYATKLQIYSSLSAILMAAWAKNKKYLLRQDIKDPATISFYNEVSKGVAEAVEVDKIVAEQERRITVYEAKKYAKEKKKLGRRITTP